MGKFKYKSTQGSVSVTTKRELTSAELSFLVGLVSDGEPTLVATPKEPSQPAEAKQKAEDVVIRKRLPNRKDSQVGAVDLSALSIDTEGGLVAYKRFRCPACGQSSALLIEGVPIVRDYTSADSKTYRCHDSVIYTAHNEDTAFKAFSYEEATDAVIEEVLLGCSLTNTCDCPMCGHHDKQSEFIRAYQEPEKFFELEAMCALCGSECSAHITEDGEGKMSCENCDTEYYA